MLCSVRLLTGQLFWPCTAVDVSVVLALYLWCMSIQMLTDELLNCTDVVFLTLYRWDGSVVETSYMFCTCWRVSCCWDPWYSCWLVSSSDPGLPGGGGRGPHPGPGGLVTGRPARSPETNAGSLGPALRTERRGSETESADRKACPTSRARLSAVRSTHSKKLF